MPALPDEPTAYARASAANPELLAADRESAIEARRLGLFKAERLPVPVLSLGADFNAPGEFDVGGRAGLSLSLPLFSRNQGEIAGSLARERSARGPPEGAGPCRRGARRLRAGPGPCVA